MTGTAPDIATSWNVYAGSDPKVLTLQNAGALVLGTPWVQPNAMVTAGRAGRERAIAELLCNAVPRTIQRG